MMVRWRLPLVVGLLSWSMAGANAFKPEVRLERVPGSKAHKAIIHDVIAAAPADVWAVLMDFDNYRYFMPRVKESRIQHREAQRLRYYSYLNMPWPIADVSYECEVTVVEPLRKFSFALVPGTGKGVEVFSGDWELTPWSGNMSWTRVTYTLLFVPSRYYPQWTVQAGTKATLGRTVKSLRQRLNTLNQLRGSMGLDGDDQP